LAGVRRSVLARAERRRRWLESSAAREQRAVSRMAFHGLRAGPARSLLVRDYGSVLAGVSANPAASVGRRGTVVRYEGDYRAVVRTARGLEVEDSSVPLRVGGSGAGGGRSVDLSLGARGEGFAPANPLVGLSIARDSGGGVGVGVDGLRVTFEGSSVPGSLVGTQSVFFGGVGADMDAVVAPSLSGAEFFAVLRSRLSPELLRYRVALPAGATLQAVAGGAVVSRGGVTLARVPVPSAQDAQGTAVPVQMRVDGDELLLSVGHRERDVAYPVLVDPEVRIPLTGSSEGWSFRRGGVGGLTDVAPGGTGSLSIAGPPTTFPVTHEGKEFHNAWGIWEITQPSTPEFTRVEFVNTKFSAMSVNEKGEPAEGTYAVLNACVRAYAIISNDSPPPPSSIILEPEYKVKCNSKPIWVEFELSQDGTTDSGEISVGAIVAYHAATAEEEEAIEAEEYGESNAGQPYRPKCLVGKPVDCATGNEVDTQTDLSVGGRGLGLNMTRTYSSQMAAKQATHGPFGFGWSGPYSARIGGTSECINRFACAFPVYLNNGSVVAFEMSYGGGAFVAANPLTQAALVNESGTYVFTLPDQTKLDFNSTGQLTSETDRNGNTTTMKYNSEGQLESVSDPSGRKITFAYNSEGEVESVKDPMGHTVKYTYESGNLVSVTEPGESGLRWQFKYNGEHEMTSETDGRGNTTTVEYTARKVTSQTDPLGRTRKWSYSSSGEKKTTITEPNGSKTVEQFNSAGEVTSVTRASETSIAATTTYEYNSSDELIAVTDPNKHTTTYGYDSAGDRTSETDPDGDETKWAYDSNHDVETMTTPDGETTTIKRESHGNPEVIERPAPGSKTQKTTYKYDSYGDLTSETDPLERTRTFEYDSYGDRIAEVDPAGDKRTWGYNEDSQETSTVSPKGNVSGGEPAVFTTTIERDDQGRPPTLTEPLGEPSYNFQFGSSGSGNGQFDLPTWDAIDSSGNIWVVDKENNRIEKFSSSGTFIQAMGFGVSNGEKAYEICTTTCKAGILGSGNGQFDKPSGISVNQSTGNVYVSDYGNDRIQEFSSSGTFIRTFGSPGSGSGELTEPDQNALDASGNVWVVDYGNNRLMEFSAEGTFEMGVGWGVKDGKAEAETCTTSCEDGIGGAGNGQLFDAQSVAISGGNVYVDDRVNARIQEFSSTGSYIRKWGTKGTSDGQFMVPFGIAASPTTGNLYVSDQESDCVQEFTPSGVFVTKFGTQGTGSGQFSEPRGIAINTSGEIYVADTGNQRIEELKSSPPRVTKYTYDGNGNLETQTDPNGNKTKYTYDADNELIKVEEPTKTVTETEYDSAGQVASQTDGNKHTTKYVRNALEEVAEVVDPLGRKTIKEYDLAGNLVSVTNPAKQTATYTYDPANRLTEIKYSDGKTPTVKYEYNKDDDRTAMTDGTGTSKYTYDQLDRLTETENGNKEKIKYEYDLGNEQTKITYPNEKNITRAYDKDGRLEKITDWFGNATKFTYDPDSDLASTVFPTSTTDEDKYFYNEADQMSELKILKGTETLASLVYTRDSNEQITTMTSKGLPGEEKTSDEYDANDRLTKGATAAYEYDAANNPTKIATGTYKYNEADELESGPSLTYTYNELGERTKTTPSTGPATTYGYDEAGNLISVERPKEGEIPKIEDTYAYNGEGLRASQAVSGTTSYIAWDMAEELPLILSDGTNSYVYGPGGLPVEQINTTTGTVTYLHHDQAGSTRLLTGSTGTVTGKCTYNAYGTPTCEGTTTTPLGYDGQYTSSDTGLIYLRHRIYDPATAQFLSVDPMVGQTHAPYNYAEDNPLDEADPTGLGNWLNLGLPSPGEVAETLNPIKYYEEEVESYENGCGYFASVAHGLEGAVVGALDASGAGEEELGAEAADQGIAGVIKGYTQHGLEQAIERDAGRGVSPSAILDAVRSPLSESVQDGGRTKFVGQNAVVVVNGEGQIVTTYPLNSAGLRGQP
jgi:RHS repeat-associated protein